MTELNFYQRRKAFLRYMWPSSEQLMSSSNSWLNNDQSDVMEGRAVRKATWPEDNNSVTKDNKTWKKTLDVEKSEIARHVFESDNTVDVSRVSNCPSSTRNLNGRRRVSSKKQLGPSTFTPRTGRSSLTYTLTGNLSYFVLSLSIPLFHVLLSIITLLLSSGEFAFLTPRPSISRYFDRCSISCSLDCRM